MGPASKLFTAGQLASHNHLARTLARGALGVNTDRALVLLETSLVVAREARDLRYLLAGYRQAQSRQSQQTYLRQVILWIQNHGPQIQRTLEEMRWRYVQRLSMFDDSTSLTERILPILASTDQNRNLGFESREVVLREGSQGKVEKHRYLASPTKSRRKTTGNVMGGQISYTLEVHQQTTVPLNAFQKRLEALMRAKKVVSFGEEHDKNQDRSFEDVLKFKDLILAAYHHLHRFEDWGDFLDVCERDFGPKIVHDFRLLLRRILSAQLEDVIYLNASRIFAIILLPLAKQLGFTHVVVEGLFERDPERSIQRSKDQIGMLLIILMSLIHGVKIRGAHAEDILQPGVAVAFALARKVNGIFDDDPASRVLTYNGALHSMTKPLKGVSPVFGPIKINLRQLTFAPAFRKRWGSGFLAIDLVTQHTSQPHSPSIFAKLRVDIVENAIREVRHSRGQIAFVFPKK